jgi:hypothetical protein
MSVLFSSTAYARSAADQFGATNQTIGFRFMIPTWTGISDWTRLYVLGDVYPTPNEGGVHVYKNGATQTFWTAFETGGGNLTPSTFAVTEAIWYSYCLKMTSTDNATQFLFNHDTESYSTASTGGPRPTTRSPAVWLCALAAARPANRDREPDRRGRGRGHPAAVHEAIRERTALVAYEPSNPTSRRPHVTSHNIWKQRNIDSHPAEWHKKFTESFCVERYF